MFVATRQKTAPPEVQLARIPQYEIFKNVSRTKFTEMERNEYTQTAQRFHVRSTNTVSINPYYDPDMVNGMTRDPVAAVVCPTDMVGYIQGDWEVSANNERYSDTLAWMAFNPGDGWRTSEWGVGSGFPCWLQWVNNRQPVRIREYSITGSASYGGPLEWRLEGKTLEDTAWTTLDAVAQSSWPNKETRTFKIPDNNHRFQMHRLYFTRATDGSNPIACVMAWSEVRVGDA